MHDDGNNPTQFQREYLNEAVTEKPAFKTGPLSVPEPIIDNFPDPVPASYSFGAVHNRRNDENYNAGMLAEAKARDRHSKACLNIRAYLEAVSDAHPGLDETSLALAIARVYAHKYLRKKFRIGGKKFDKTNISWKGDKR